MPHVCSRCRQEECSAQAAGAEGIRRALRPPSVSLFQRCFPYAPCFRHDPSEGLNAALRHSGLFPCAFGRRIRTCPAMALRLSAQKSTASPAGLTHAPDFPVPYLFSSILPWTKPLSALPTERIFCYGFHQPADGQPLPRIFRFSRTKLRKDHRDRLPERLMDADLQRGRYHGPLHLYSRIQQQRAKPFRSGSGRPSRPEGHLSGIRLFQTFFRMLCLTATSDARCHK